MRLALLTLLCGLALGCDPVRQDSPAPSAPGTGTTTTPATKPAPPASPNEPVDRTNTGVNVRDRAPSAKTPIDQNENQTDVRITADIRKQIVDTKMSVDAQNVKIITQDGKVTLRGPVKSDEEKRTIEKVAADVAGAGNVDSQLEIKSE